MSRTNSALAADVEAVVGAISDGDRFLLTTHEGVDGDALGSMLGMHLILRALGKDTVTFLPPSEFPLPLEYRFLPLDEVFHEAPADIDNRTLVFLDCGNINRTTAEFLRAEANPKINIDHHHDNTRFGDVNLVDTTVSSTAEIVFNLRRELGVALDADMATALYVGLVTDTGRFMYENTDADSHRMAADLIEAGVKVDDVYRRLYEQMPPQKLALFARAFAKIESYEDGKLAVLYLADEDFEEVGASERHGEGVIDFLRAVEGTRIAAYIRDRGEAPPARKVSLRSADGVIDVSAIAREMGGGGHKRAAGFSTDMAYDELVEYLRKAVSHPGADG